MVCLIGFTGIYMTLIHYGCKRCTSFFYFVCVDIIFFENRANAFLKLIAVTFKLKAKENSYILILILYDILYIIILSC